MKKRVIQLSSIIFLSFFMIASVVAQEKPQDVKKKAKTEMVKKDISKKCKGCPSLEKCNSEAAVKARKENGKECEGTAEKPLTASEKRKIERTKKK
ncbi:MAG: hypothetical protein KAR19_13495 [Bacteroidales bacterium]|nr:hypothetical protein [Bacteroidales bacterium]